MALQQDVEQIRQVGGGDRRLRVQHRQRFGEQGGKGGAGLAGPKSRGAGAIGGGGHCLGGGDECVQRIGGADGDG